MDKAPPNCNIRYFLAAFPQGNLLTTLIKLRNDTAFATSIVNDGRLHCTFCVLQHAQEPVEDVHDRVSAMFRDQPLEALDLWFGRFLSNNVAASVEAVGKHGAFRKAKLDLAKQAEAYGFCPVRTKKALPHFTLGYGSKGNSRRSIPLQHFYVDRLVLVESRLGEGLHFHLGTFKLRSPTQGRLPFQTTLSS